MTRDGEQAIGTAMDRPQADIPDRTMLIVLIVSALLTTGAFAIVCIGFFA